MITKAPKRTALVAPSVFLAGSIEMGAAEDWQTRAGATLEAAGFHVLSPRRDDWDSTWVQSIDNPQFREQVEWELEYLEGADYILLYLCPDTKSPISLLELGLFASSGRLTVACPAGFWRKGNVEIVCHRYFVPLVETLDEAVASLIEKPR